MTPKACATVWIALVLLASAVSKGAESAAPKTSTEVENVRNTRRQLWRDALRAPKDATKTTELEREMAQLLAAEAKTGKTLPSAPTTPPAAESQPATTLDAPKPPAPPRQADAEVTLSSELLARLQQLAPRGIARPATLADSLFLGGHFEAAGDLYRFAMQRKSAPDQRAWLLFQMANCKRKSDPAMARGLYRRLLAEHPDSPWSPVADVQQNLIEWRRVNQPERLLKALQTAERSTSTSRPVSTPDPSPAPTAPVAGGGREKFGEAK